MSLVPGPPVVNDAPLVPLPWYMTLPSTDIVTLPLERSTMVLCGVTVTVWYGPGYCGERTMVSGAAPSTCACALHAKRRRSAHPVVVTALCISSLYIHPEALCALSTATSDSCSLKCLLFGAWSRGGFGRQAEPALAVARLKSARVLLLFRS